MSALSAELLNAILIKIISLPNNNPSKAGSVHPDP